MAWSVLAQTAGTAQAQTYTWTNSVTGNWSAGANWGGSAPVSGTTTVLNFGAPIGTSTTAFTATNDFPGSFTLNQLNLNANGNGTNLGSFITIAGNAVTLDGSNAAVTVPNTDAASVILSFSSITLSQTAVFTDLGGLLSVHSPVNMGSNNLVVGVANTTGGGGATFSGAISGTGSLTVNGYFTQVTLNAANSFSGGVIVNGAGSELDLNHNLGGNNVLASGSSVSLSGGAISMTSKQNATSSQLLGDLTLTGGANSVILSPFGTGTMLATMGNNWTRSAGATLNLILPANTTLTSAPTLTGTTIIGAWATVGTSTTQLNAGAMTDWATVIGGVVMALPAANYNTFTAAGSTAWSGDVSYNPTTTAIFTVSSDGAANSLRIASGAAVNVTLNLSGTNTIATGGILVSSSATSGNQTISGGSIVPGGTELVINAGGSGAFNTLTISSSIGVNGGGSNNFGVTKAGHEIAIFSGSNFYTGATIVNAGQLRFNSLSAYSNSSGVLINYGAAASINYSSFTTSDLTNHFSTASAGGLLLQVAPTAASLSLSGYPFLTLGASGFSITYAGTLTPGGANNSTYMLGGGMGSLILSATNALSGASNSLIVGTNHTENGNVVLAAANNYGGGTVLAGGEALQIASGASIGTGGITFTGNANLQFNGSTILTSNQTITANGSNLANLIVSGTGLTITINSLISGQGGLLVSGTVGSTGNIFLLNVANNYGGGTSIGNNIVRSGVTNALPITTILSLPNGSPTEAFDLNGFDQQIAGLTGTGATPGNITLGGATLTISGATTNTYGGVISGAGNLVFANGSGTETFINTNTYGGSTTINSGKWQAGIANALPSGTAVMLANASNATLDLNNFNQTIGSLAGGGSSGGNVTTGVGAGGVLTISGSATTVYSGVISGNGGLTISGSGSLSLTGASTYSAGTTINSGALIANTTTGSATGAGNVTVNGGLLAGAGTITPSAGNSVTINGGGTLRGGDPTVSANNFGTLSINNNVTLISTGNGASTSAAIQTQVARTAAGSVAGSNSLINLSGAVAATFNLGTSGAPLSSSNLLTLNVLDGGTLLAGDGSYTINLAKVAAPNGSNTKYTLNGTTIVLNPTGPNNVTIIDQGTSAGIAGAGQYAMLAMPQASANLITGWTLQIDSSGQFLQLSLATPEPHHLLLICAVALFLGLAIRRVASPPGTHRAPPAIRRYARSFSAPGAPCATGCCETVPAVPLINASWSCSSHSHAFNAITAKAVPECDMKLRW